MKRKIEIDKISSILLVIPALINVFARYQEDSTLGTNTIRSILRVIVYLCTSIEIIFVINSLKFRKIKFVDILAILPMFFFYFLSIRNYDGSLNFSKMLMLILWILYCLLKDNIKKDTFILWKKAFFIICGIGILCYVLYIIGLASFKNVNYYVKDFSSSYYIDCGVTFLYKEANLVRLCGICNEPGLFGTLCALLLCASGMNVKDKKNWVIFIAGLLTYSVAFIVIIMVYLLLKSLNNPKVFCITAILICLYIFVLPNVKTNNPTLNKLIYRISINENGQLNGDNRSNYKLDSLCKNVIHNHPLFGMGNGYVGSMSVGAVLSYKTYIVNYGILGSGIIWGLLLLSALYKNIKNKNIIFYVIAFFASIYQRPHIMTLFYEILLYGGILYIKENSKNQKKEMINLKMKGQ